MLDSWRVWLKPFNYGFTLLPLERRERFLRRRWRIIALRRFLFPPIHTARLKMRILDNLEQLSKFSGITVDVNGSAA